MDAKNKSILAALLIVVWAGLAVWQWRLLQEPVRVPLTNIAGLPLAGRHSETGRGGLRVNLDLHPSTGLQRQTTFTTPRNIFAWPRPDGTLGTVPASGNTPSEASTQQENAPESEPYRYLGFLRVGEGRLKNADIAVLRKDDEVLVLKVGDHVDDRLILKAINPESVIIRNTGTHRDLTVSLSEESSDESSEEPAHPE